MALDNPVVASLVQEFVDSHGLSKVFPKSKGLADVIDYSLSAERAQERIDMLSQSTIGRLRGRQLLEIGSGFGLFVAITRGQEIISYGIEPDPIACEIALKVLQQHGVRERVIARAVGERLPFPDESFDIVFSDEVLEHTDRPEQVIAEAIRVLKTGGYLHLLIPNYASFWEGHYSLLWIPRLPKPLAKAYVRLCGRNPAFIDRLHFITPQYLHRVLTSHRDVEVLDWGIDAWECKVKSMSFSPWSPRKLRWPVRIAHLLRVTRLLTALGRMCEFYTPIVLTVLKASDHPPLYPHVNAKKGPTHRYE